MKRATPRFLHFLLTLTLLLAMVGCSGKEPMQTNWSDAAPTTLTIADLKEIFGEKSGDIVTLWGASFFSGETAVLTLQKSGSSWIIQSFQVK